MKSSEKENAGASAAGTKGERVRGAIGKALSSDEAGVESAVENGGVAVADRQPVPTSQASEEVAKAAQKRLAEIEARVGELVHDPELERDGKTRSGT